MESKQTPELSQNIELNKTCKITRINFDGVRKTSTKLVSRIVADIFNSRTLLEAVDKTAEAKAKLDTLDAFSKSDVLLEKISNDNNEEYEVTFSVKEGRRLAFSAQTAVDDHSTHFSLQLASPNLNGIGDCIQLNSKLNSRHKFNSVQCKYSVPLMPWRTLWSPKYSLSYDQNRWDSLPCGIDEEDKAICNQIDFFSIPNLHHAISFDNIWRYIKSSSLKNTPIEIRGHSGHSIKSSVKHCMTWDNREGGNFPHEGVLAKLSNEFTTNLVNGAAKFTRHELELQFNALLLPKYDLLCQFNFLAGTLLKAQRTNICDRFIAGGPLTIRGFKLGGLEPVVDGIPLGNSSFFSAGAHLYPKFPYTTTKSKINKILRPHLFFNIGTLGETPEIRRLIIKDEIPKELQKFANSLRYSCGFGLVLYFGNLRLEVNYCLPLVFKQNDQTVKGVQWGFGISYT